MNRVRRPARAVVQPEPAEDGEGLDEEPAYEREEGESTNEAQDRIEAKYRVRATSPLRAIRAFCVLCMGAQPKEVAKCTSKRCPLFLFRAGKNPYQKHKKEED